jgi:hypothetical protein
VRFEHVGGPEKAHDWPPLRDAISGRPISAAPVTGVGDDLLTAYLSNGVLGLRVRELPVLTGVAFLSGLAGEHPVDHVESTPRTPTAATCPARANGGRL